MLHAALLLLMLEAVTTDLVSPSTWSAAPNISAPWGRAPWQCWDLWPSPRKRRRSWPFLS